MPPGRPDPRRTTAAAPKLWGDGRLRLRVIGPEGVGTVVLVDRPFAVIGRAPGADLPVPDAGASTQHVYLHLDRIGLFAVDLATRGGTRFDDAPEGARACWIRPGRGLELAGHRVELIEATPAGLGQGPGPGNPDGLLAEASGLVRLELRPEGAPDRPIRLLSTLSFLGRSRSCTVRAEGEGVGRFHAVLVRSTSGAFLVDLTGGGLGINGRPPIPAAPIRDGDLLEFGRTRFRARVRPAPTALVRPPSSSPAPIGAQAGHALQPVTVAPEELLRSNEPFQQALIAVVRQIYREHETLFERHLERLDRLQAEVAELREEVRRRLDPAPAVIPPALDPPPLQVPRPPAPDEPGRATSWLIDRLGALEAEVDREARSGWRDLFSRLGPPLRTPGDA